MSAYPGPVACCSGVFHVSPLSKALKRVFFPPPPDANLADIDDITYPNPVKLDKLVT